MNLNNIQIVTSEYLVKQVKRTWKERLFSRPWNPFKKTKYIPDNKHLYFDNKIICHPAMEKQLRETLEKLWRK